MGWDAASNLVTAAYPNNLTSTYTYDALNRLTELSTSTSPVADYKYTLGATGIRTNATEQAAARSSGATTTSTGLTAKPSPATPPTTAITTATRPIASTRWATARRKHRR